MRSSRRKFLMLRIIHLYFYKQSFKEEFFVVSLNKYFIQKVIDYTFVFLQKTQGKSFKEELLCLSKKVSNSFTLLFFSLKKKEKLHCA